MRAIVTALLLIAWLHRLAVATPVAGRETPHDRDGTPRASADPETANTPWIDLAPSAVFEARDRERSNRKRNSLLILGSLYAGFVGWTYLAWYRTESHEFRVGGDVEPGASWYEWFGTRTYAAGADKWGHAWATLGLARGGTELLHQYGGYSKLASAIAATALSEALFLGVEIKDGFAYSFSLGDLAFNTGGAVLALAQSMSPRIDEAIDLRVEYFPSKAYRRLWTAERNIDWAEDYSGQTYLLAFHLKAIHGLRDSRYLGWSQYVDVAFGFDTRGYKPDPPWSITEEMPDYDKRQRWFLGVTLNAQGVFDSLLGGGRAEGLRKFTHGLFEVFNVPSTTLPLVDSVRVPMGDVPNDGA